MPMTLTPETSPNLSSKHGFFGREGGVSDNEYKSLNTGLGTDDKDRDVIENRGLIAKHMGVKPTHLLNCYQTHSNKCVVVDDIFDLKDRPEADALVTDVTGIAIGVVTADCVPVLIEGQKSNGDPVIGAAHAGWKGAVGGILSATVQAMIGKGAEIGSLKAAIGPCIQQASYEVGVDLYDRFVNENEANEHFFLMGRDLRHFQFDLPGFVAKELAAAGCSNVYISDTDTYKEEGGFFSYRRATHQGKSDYGRQLSCILVTD